MISYNEPENITSEVKEIINHLLDEIQEASKKFLVADVGYNVFYLVPTSWSDLIQTLGVLTAWEPATHTFKDWISKLKNNRNRQYQAVVITATAKYRSTLETALMEIYNKNLRFLFLCSKNINHRLFVF